VSTLLDISISLDGYATGPNASDAAPMGIGGERLDVLGHQVGDRSARRLDQVGGLRVRW
jgi:hypothetical protein